MSQLHKRDRAPGRVARLTRYAWAAPCSAVGVLIAFVAMLLGARIECVEGTLEAAVSRQGSRLAGLSRRSPFSAITFGHVIIGVNRDELARLRSHEQQHVRQYELWGPLFFIAYPASSLAQWLRGRDPYWHNRFEVQARANSSDVRDEA